LATTNIYKIKIIKSIKATENSIDSSFQRTEVKSDIVSNYELGKFLGNIK